MRYGHFHSLGYPIGSGTVESGAKNVGLGVRLLPPPPKLPKILSYTPGLASSCPMHMVSGIMLQNHDRGAREVEHEPMLAGDSEE